MGRLVRISNGKRARGRPSCLSWHLSCYADSPLLILVNCPLSPSVGQYVRYLEFTSMEAAVLPPERGHGIQAARNMLQLQSNGCIIAPAGRSYWKFRVTSF
jgi:hypothetical protein